MRYYLQSRPRNVQPHEAVAWRTPLIETDNLAQRFEFADKGAALKAFFDIRKTHPTHEWRVHDTQPDPIPKGFEVR